MTAETRYNTPHVQDPRPNRYRLLESFESASGRCLTCGWSMQIIHPVYLDMLEHVEKQFGPWRLCMCGGYERMDKETWWAVEGERMDEEKKWPLHKYLNYKYGSLPRVEVK